MSRFTQVKEQVRRIVTRPVDELNRWQRSARYFVDLMRHCWRQLMEDRAEEMAAALTYRTIFSLIPLLVLGLVVFRVFGGFENVKDNLEDPLFRLFGVFDVPEAYVVAADEAVNGAAAATLVVPQQQSPTAVTIDDESLEQAAAERRAAAEGDPEAVVAVQKSEEEVRASIRRVLTDMMARIMQLDFATVGIVGLAFLIYAAMALMIAIEYDFNIIYKAPTGRPWQLRLPIYWSLITLGVALLALTFWLTGRIRAEVEEVFGPLRAINHVFALMTSWLMLFLLYFLMPNTRVHVRAAVIGAFVAAVLWEASKVGFQWYVNTAVPYAAFYGTLGLPLLFMLWIYLSWLIVLFGLELTYAVQTVRGRRSLLRTAADECDALLDPRWLIPIMTSVGGAFERGATVTVEQLSDSLSLPVRAVSQLVQQLHKAGLLRRVMDGHDDEDPGYVLATRPELVTVPRLLELGRDMSMQERALKRVPGRELLHALTRAEREAVQSQTLADLLKAADTGSSTTNGHG
jgi:membrane protein